MKNKTYKDGLIEGYKKGQKDTIKVHKEGEERIKPIREIIEKLRRLRG